MLDTASLPSVLASDATISHDIIAAVASTLHERTGLSPDQCDEMAADMCDGQPWQSQNFQAPKRRLAVKKGNHFVLAFVENMLELARLGVSKREWEVLAYILKQMEFGNLVAFSQAACARDLSLCTSTVSTIFKSLRTKGVLVETNGHLFVNSNLFMKGLMPRMKKDRAANLKAAASTAAGAFKSVME